MNIIECAIVNPVCDIGQFDSKTLRELNKAVKAGILSKGKGGPYPMLKTMYAVAGFNFMADRENIINRAMLIRSIESMGVTI